MNSFLHTKLGRTDLDVHRLALSATYLPGKKAIHKALDAGVNLVLYAWSEFQMKPVMRKVLASNRDKIVILAAGRPILFGKPELSKSLDALLKKMSIDHVDVFLCGMVLPKMWTEIHDSLMQIRESGKARYVGISSHDRPFLGQLAREGEMDLLMVRYNAAHRGAEKDIFPYLQQHDPGVIAYTATRWRTLLKRPRDWPPNGYLPTAGDCYRFTLSNPYVHACFTAPTNLKQLEENLRELEKGPMNEEELSFICEFGDAVYRQKMGFFPQPK
ncbi:MAG: aldo/keto reductase [Candidatus Electryonea clarkiae]|nr:aldo/keto reductase [Candidatus Electryonea clarkiae]MDP8287848.1 aldo/keto reductase [Candidatus Electryonea clarkiae]